MLCPPEPVWLHTNVTCTDELTYAVPKSFKEIKSLQMFQKLHNSKSFIKGTFLKEKFVH